MPLRSLICNCWQPISIFHRISLLLFFFTFAHTHAFLFTDTFFSSPALPLPFFTPLRSPRLHHLSHSQKRSHVVVLTAICLPDNLTLSSYVHTSVTHPSYAVLVLPQHIKPWPRSLLSLAIHHVSSALFTCTCYLMLTLSYRNSPYHFFCLRMHISPRSSFSDRHHSTLQHTVHRLPQRQCWQVSAFRHSIHKHDIL